MTKPMKLRLKIKKWLYIFSSQTNILKHVTNTGEKIFYVIFSLGQSIKKEMFVFCFYSGTI